MRNSKFWLKLTRNCWRLTFHGFLEQLGRNQQYHGSRLGCAIPLGSFVREFYNDLLRTVSATDPDADKSMTVFPKLNRQPRRNQGNDDQGFLYQLHYHRDVGTQHLEGLIACFVAYLAATAQLYHANRPFLQFGDGTQPLVLLDAAHVRRSKDGLHQMPLRRANGGDDHLGRHSIAERSTISLKAFGAGTKIHCG